MANGTKGPGTMIRLQQVVTSMEMTREQTDPVRELRHWRLQAERRNQAAKAKAAAAAKGPGRR